MENKLNEKKIEIQELTNLGHDHLTNESASEAINAFLEAFQIAKLIDDEYTLRGCRFNLGACYVASGNAKVGLRYLEQAVPPGDLDDGEENFADLWYNIGVARHAINEIDEAIVAYEKAQKAYKEMLTNNRLEAECLSKLAVCYHLKNELEESRDMYAKAQKIYKQLNDKSNQALCLVSETGVLSQMGKIDECAKTLDVLLDVCQEIDDKHIQAKIYHDIGLLYMSEKLYESAGECLQQALSCIEESDSVDKHLHATVLQNIGAVCNYMKIFPKSISFHQSSADIYGEIGDRKAQTQVFNNLAYAYTQTENYTEAITAFQHAIQAAKDSGDKESQCLATEGTAAIWFRLKQYKKAVIFYKEAMRILTLSSQQDFSHSDRIVDKLVDAIQYQLNEEDKHKTGAQNAKTTATDTEEHAHKGKPRFSFDKKRSLIARGLEVTPGDSSEVGSSEDDDDDDDDDDDGEEEEEELSNNSKPTFSRHKGSDVTHSKPCGTPKREPCGTPKRDVEHFKNEDEGGGGSTLRTNYYEEPVTNLTRAEEELYLCSVAEQHDAKHKVSPVRNRSSKTCLLM